MEVQLKAEVKELFDLGECVDQGEIQVPDGMVVENEIAIRAERLSNLVKA